MFIKYDVYKNINTENATNVTIVNALQCMYIRFVTRYNGKKCNKCYAFTNVTKKIRL